MLTGKNILIVDDDRINVLALSAVLKQEEPNLFFAYNGKECLQYLEKNANINLILLDLMMPELDGYETIKQIKALYSTQNIPIIIITARVIRGDKQKLLEAGADAYIEKPIVFNELLKSICELCA
jgi:two-component system chemotaxis sensor kinase CheA